MVTFSKKTASLIIASCFLITSLFAKQLPIPAFREYVNDYANVITSHDEQEIIRYCSKLEDTTGIQIAVLTMPSLQGEDITSFSMRVCDAWGIGQKGNDNGALLILACEERDIRIEVGYGLEGKLTDAKCGLILRNVIIPELREGNYSAGLLKGVQNIGGIASDDATLVSKQVSNSSDDTENSFIALLFFIIWIIFFISVITSKNGLFKWLILSRLFGTSGRNYRRTPTRSSFTNTTTGFRGPTGGFGGGFGGSSFHGGGGGHFGGGGATGHF